MSDYDLYYGDFERDGEEAVRSNLALKRYREDKAALAQTWLALKDQGRKDASQAESLAIAASAKDAAWAAADAARVAAREAKTANKIAKLALLTATIAIGVSVIGLFHH